MIRTTRTVSTALLALATMLASLAAAPATERLPRLRSRPTVAIEFPPEGFFPPGPEMDVVVRFAPAVVPGWLSLEVDGVRRGVVGSGSASDGRHTFRIPVDVMSPPRSLVVRWTVRGAEATASVHGAGPAEVALARQTLEELAQLDNAVRAFTNRRNSHPSDLASLAPEFLPEPIVTSPFGTPYEYEAAWWHWQLRVRLPGGAIVRMVEARLVEVPPSLLSAPELGRFNRRLLSMIALGCEAFNVDFSHYPASIDELYPTYLEAVTPNDAFGRPILLDLRPDGYALTSYGRDGRPGGAGLDADLLVTTGQIMEPHPGPVSVREYVSSTRMNLSWMCYAVERYARTFGRVPASLADIGPRDPWESDTDACGRALVYAPDADAKGFTLSALGYPCSVDPGTPLWVTERLDRSRCDETQGLTWQPGLLD